MSEVAICVCSCDAFLDVHDSALACIDKFWPDKPSDWPIYTTSNLKPWGKHPILTGGIDAGWVANLSNALDHLSEPLVCLWLDDMLISRPVDTAACIEATVLLALQPIIGAVRLGQGDEKQEWDAKERGMSCPIPWTRVTVDSQYSISTSPTLWRVSYLRKILENCGTTAHDFEIRGTIKSRELPEEIWVQSCPETERAFRVFYTAITKESDGKSRWNRDAVEWLKRDLGIEVDVSRGFMGAR